MTPRQGQRGTWTQGVLLVAVVSGLAGCAGTEVLDKTASDVLDQAEKLQIYKHQVSLTKNPIDQALAACPRNCRSPKRIASGEA